MNEVVNEVPMTEEPTVTEVVTEVRPQPGEKTDSALLLKSLQDEREKRRILEAELEVERNRKVLPQGEVFSDEGKLLDSKIVKLEAELLASKQEKELSAIEGKYPALRDKSVEFEQFLQDNQGMRLETAAKAFLTENDLLGESRPRKGLETSSGGGRAPVQTGMTPEEIDNLRVNNYREYVRRLKNGTLK